MIFDWISPLIGIGQDVTHAITDGRPTFTLFVPTGLEVNAKEILRDNKFKVISETRATFSKTVGIDIPRVGGKDGWESVREATQLLNGHGIDVSYT